MATLHTPFITIEGVEGAGKSSLQHSLAEEFKKSGRKVTLTREPGATALGQIIRKTLLTPGAPINPRAELFLFAADRAQHVAEVIEPARRRGEVVICDRFIHSTLAYQGFGRGLDLDELRELNELATGGLLPDFVILLDLDPKIGLSRVKQREAGDQTDRFESQELAFHTRVREGFLELAKSDSKRFIIAQAERSASEVLTDVLRELRTRNLL